MGVSLPPPLIRVPRSLNYKESLIPCYNDKDKRNNESFLFLYISSYSNDDSD